MKEKLNLINAREEELWGMKSQLRGLPAEHAHKARVKIETELSRLSRERMAIATGRAA